MDRTRFFCSGIYEPPGRLGAKAIGLLAGIPHQNERGVSLGPVKMRIEGVWIET